MKKLIINADDFGLAKQINEAVKISYQKGVITDTSLASCGGAFLDACEILESLSKKEVGIHLVLTGGYFPVRSEGRSILSKKGTFVPSYLSLAKLVYTGHAKRNEIYSELKAQIEKIKSKGLNVTHIDGHEHVHILPGVIDVVINLAKEYNINYIRLPLESFNIIKKDFRFKDLIRHLALKFFSYRAKQMFNRSGIKHNDHFLGHFHAGRITRDLLKYMLKNLDPGVTELAVHPAVVRGEFLKENPWYKNAEVELKSLESMDNVNKEDVSLISCSML